MTALASPAHASRDLALELHGLLKQIDPARWTPRTADALRQRLVALRESIGAVLDRFDPRGHFAGLHAALSDVFRLLGELPDPTLPVREGKRAWKALSRQLTATYDDLSKALEGWDIHVPALRPTNYSRNVLHVGMGTAAAVVLGLFPYRTVLLSIIIPIALWAWSMEYFRRDSTWLNDKLMTALGRFAHPHEWHRVNSATWYASALLLLAWADVPQASMVALLSLAWGDPSAALVGRRWGRTKLVNGRSLEGTLAFVAVGAVASTVGLVFAFGIAAETAALASLAGATVGALAELFSRRIDDNFSIPVSAAIAAGLVLG